MQTYNILQQEPQPNFKRLTNTLAYMALENIYVGPYLGFANTDKTTKQVEYTALEKSTLYQHFAMSTQYPY